MVDRPIEITLLLLLSVQLVIGVSALRIIGRIGDKRFRWLLYAVFVVVAGMIGGGSLLNVGRIRQVFPDYYFGERWRMAVTLWLTASAFSCTMAYVTGRLLRSRKHPDAVDLSRRRFITAAQTMAAVAPVAVIGYAAFIERKEIRTVEIDLPVAGLAPDLDGIHIVQISDIHLSPTMEERDLARVIDQANEVRPDLAVVTGDLITKRRDPLYACMRQLARLRASAGVYGCLGNHERWAQVETEVVELGRRCDIDILRYESRLLRFGSAELNLVGVDYERLADESQYLRQAEHLVRPQCVNVLLSHSPDVIAAAARKGFDVTLAGHTHGGQVTLEFVHPSINVARYYTPFVYGRYDVSHGGKTATSYVTRGIGTIFVPARLGAPPELAVIRLRRA